MRQDQVPVPTNVHVGLDRNGNPVSAGSKRADAEHPDAKIYAIYKVITAPIQDPTHPGYGRSGLGPV